MATTTTWSHRRDGSKHNKTGKNGGMRERGGGEENGKGTKWKHAWEQLRLAMSAIFDS